MVKNPPANAGDMGLIPGPETKISHAVEELSLCSARGEATAMPVPLTLTDTNCFYERCFSK